jgi:ribonuclease-3
MRASLVNARCCHEAAALSLGQWLRLGSGEERSGGREKSSIPLQPTKLCRPCTLTEDSRLRTNSLHDTLPKILKEKSHVPSFDNKTRHKKLHKRSLKETLIYTVVETRGPDHERQFVSQVSIAGKLYGRGAGPNKKSAARCRF